MEATEEQTYYLWVCGKCGVANAEELIFCPNCASIEGSTNPKNGLAEKSGKVSEALSGAITWSLEHAQVKAAEVLAQAAKRGNRVSSLADLRLLTSSELDRLADNYIGANRLGATGAGFTAGLPGGLAAFATIPADISALIYFALRCAGGISQAYSFEVESETGQVVELLAFAYACRFETLVIGPRRLENLSLAHFLIQHPEPYAGLVKPCLLKQLSGYLTIDFAKTSWASFLPVVGGLVNGVDHFWFLGEVGRRSKLFYGALLSQVRPVLPSSRPEQAATLSAITIEIRIDKLPLPSGGLEVYGIGAASSEALPLVIVLWDGERGNQVGEDLAEHGLAALVPQETLSASRLQELLAYLSVEAPALFPTEIQPGKPGLLVFGAGVDVVLDTLALSPTCSGPIVLYNPLGKSRPVRVAVPVLLQLGEAAPEVDPAWAENIAGEGGPVSINGYAGVGYDFTNPTSPHYNLQASRWAWADTVAWFKRFRLE